MKGAYAVGLTAIFIVLGLETADAQSTTLQNIKQRNEAALIKDIEYTNKVCESNLTVKFNWTAVQEAALKHYSAEGYCGAALEGIRRVCVDKAGKDAVRQQIKSVTCGFGPERAISLKNGSVDYKINFNSANDGDFVSEYLQNQL